MVKKLLGKYVMLVLTSVLITVSCFAQQKEMITKTKANTFLLADTLHSQKLDMIAKPKKGMGTIFRKKSSKKDIVAKPPLSPVAKAARKAAFRSLILPGFGQVTNLMTIKEDRERLQLQGKNFVLKKIFISAKIAGIYTAETMLAYSYITNRNDAREFSAELNYRNQNSGAPSLDGKYREIQTQVLEVAKSNATRNREVSIFGFFAAHAINAIDAYTDARLRFFDVDDDLSFQISPTVIPQSQAWTTQYYPALKFTLKL